MACSLPSDHKNTGFSMAPFGEQMYVLKIQFFCDLMPCWLVIVTDLLKECSAFTYRAKQFLRIHVYSVILAVSIVYCPKQHFLNINIMTPELKYGWMPWKRIKNPSCISFDIFCKLPYLHRTNPTEYSHFWEARKPSANQESPCILRNTKVHYCVHKSPPLVPTVNQMNPLHALPFNVLKITLILCTHLYLGLPSSPSPSGFPTPTLCAFLFPGMHTTCSAHLILLDLITQTIFGKKYRS